MQTKGRSPDCCMSPDLAVEVQPRTAQVYLLYVRCECSSLTAFSHVSPGRAVLQYRGLSQLAASGAGDGLEQPRGDVLRGSRLREGRPRHKLHTADACGELLRIAISFYYECHGGICRRCNHVWAHRCLTCCFMSLVVSPSFDQR